jgi:glucose/arabinose dehydrogenase
LVLLRDGQRIPPHKDGQFVARLVEWSRGPRVLNYCYELKFPGLADDESVTCIVDERVATAAAGFVRTIDVRHPADLKLELRLIGSEALQDARISDGGKSLVVPDRFTISASETIGPDGTLPFTVGRAVASRLILQYAADQSPPPFRPAVLPVVQAQQQPLAVIPGMTATRLPLDARIMPTGFAWGQRGENAGEKLFIASLEGRVWSAHDASGDNLEDASQPISDELAAPYGIAVPADDPTAVDVAAKYGIVRLHLDDAGQSKKATILADGWGHTDDYHDWAVGFAATTHGYLLALPCQQDNRSVAAARFRGQVLDIRIQGGSVGAPPKATLRPVSSGHRFPMGIARNRAGDVFVTDNQGNYNPFNELNHVQPGKDFGFINAIDKNRPRQNRPPLTPPAINIPHPWTRSVNGICFLQSPRQQWGPFEDHLIGCEYDTRRLIRMSLQKVGDAYQGACYPFSLENSRGENFLGPISCAVSPSGDLYIGSIRDSGWGGGANVGEVVRIAPPTDWKTFPAGIAEVKAFAGGFTLDFTQPVDGKLAADAKNYSLASYTRESTPAYGGPDKNRRAEKISRVELSADRRRATLHIDELRTGFVYEFHVKNLAVNGDATFFPAEAYYTLNRVPTP